MKTGLRVFVLASVMPLLSFGADSAEPETVLVRQPITIGEFAIGNHYTEEQIADITESVPMVISKVEGETICVFHYEGETFYTRNGELYCFHLQCNPSLKLNGVVGVGDDLHKINLLKPCMIDYEDTNTGATCHYVHMSDKSTDESPIIFIVKDGVISQITYMRQPTESIVNN